MPPPPLRWLFAVAHARFLRKRGAYIPLETQFAGRPEFPHGLNGVFIASGAAIGRDVTIYQQVTIGKNRITDSAGFGFPTIGDGAYLGAGAKVIGGVTVGDHARVGANAVVVKDVPANATVVLSPTRIIQRHG